MAEFYTTLSQKDIASQIAALINHNNQLKVLHSRQSITSSPTSYFVEVYGGSVAGCVGLLRQYPTLSLIKHLCVDVQYRRNGLASKLLVKALTSCTTAYAYMTVRDDNVACLSLAKKFDFVVVKSVWSTDHYVVTLGRRTPNVNPSRC